MNLNLKDKVVVVTGGAQGIGQAMAAAYAAEGCKIAICDINESALKDAEKYFSGLGHTVMTCVLDLCDNAAVRSFAESVTSVYGHLDVWLNNAGILFPKPILEQELADFERVIRVNLSSAFNGTQAAAIEMKKSGGGVITRVCHLIKPKMEP